MKHRHRKHGSQVRLIGDGDVAILGDAFVTNEAEESPSSPKASAQRAKRKRAKNAGKAAPLAKLDPTNTFSLRKQFCDQLKRQFALLKERIIRQIGTEDVLGLGGALNQSTKMDVHLAAQRVDVDPTDAQKEAGNYRMGHVTFRGIPLTIETPKGVKRKPYHDKPVAAHYGYAKRTRSEADGDHVDVFLGGDLDSDRAFIVDQFKQDGSFDEHKSFLGFPDAESAEAAYRDSYSDDWQGFEGITELSITQFKWWLKEGDTSRPVQGQTINSSEPDPELAQERELIHLAKWASEKKDSPDYGQLFLKTETQEVWYVSADGDDNLKWLEEELAAAPLVRKVTVEAEAFPPSDGSWMQLWPKVKRWVNNANPNHDEKGRFTSGGQTETVQFKEWFGTSKVVDDDGHPLRVFHGTPTPGFDVFDEEKKGTNTSKVGDAARMFHFSDSPRVADTYSKAHENVTVTDKLTKEKMEKYGIKEQIKRTSGLVPVYLRMENPLHVGASKNITAEAIEGAKRKGHDGLIADLGNGETEYVPFSSKQIKSAMGNKGTFSGEDPSILNSSFQGMVENAGCLPLIEVPDVRQREDWDCGAAACMSVGQHFGVGPDTLTGWVDLLGTDETDGTDPQAIFKVLRGLGLRCVPRDGLTLDDLSAAQERGEPVLCPVQAWGTPAEERRGRSGHWLVVLGRGLGYVFAQDPSASKATKDGPHAPGRVMIREQDFLDAWFDVGADGTEYVKFGLIVGLGSVRNSNPEGCNQWKACGGGEDLHSLASSAIKELTAKYGEKQGSEEGISPKDICEGFCSWFAAGAVRLIQQKRSREVTVAGKANETHDVHTSRTNMDADGEGHMWVTVDGKHYDPEAPDGVDDPKDLPWFGRHEGFHVLPNESRTYNSSSQGIVRNDHFDKLEQFQEWLRQQLGDAVRGKSQEQLWDAYIKRGFAKGAGRSFDDVRKPYAKWYPEANKATQGDMSDFHRGGKEEFLRSSFAQPVAKEKVKLLASRSFDELENVTEDMSNKMSRVLTDGLVQGKSPYEVAADMVEEVDISRARAEVVARTELIRSHAEGQLTALEQLGVAEVGVAVEWSTAGDGLVCPLCSALEGVVLKIDEARGLLPRHPNCRCAFLPSGVGEDDEDQKDTKEEIDEALDEAGVEGVSIDDERPKSVLNINPNHDELGRFASLSAADKVAHLKTLDKKAASKLLGKAKTSEIREMEQAAMTKFSFGTKANLLAHTHPEGGVPAQPAASKPAVVAPPKIAAPPPVPPKAADTTASVGGREVRLPVQPSPAHARHVAEVVMELSGQHHGLVPMTRVRAELAKRGVVGHDVQDQAIRAAQRADSVTGSRLEGRHGSTQEERDALLRDPTPGGWDHIGFLSLRKVSNANPEGCNQWSGPGCGGGSSKHQALHDKCLGGIADLDLPDFMKRHLHAEMFSVLDKMNDAVKELLHRNLQSVSWQKDTEGVCERFDDIEDAEQGFGMEQGVQAFYVMGTKQAVLDGAGHLPGGTEFGDVHNAKGIHAHELTHALDHGGTFSMDPEWRAAYKAEIVASTSRRRDGSYGDPPRLSEYARHQAAEGFAEFGRALWGSSVKREEVKAKFPKCWAFVAKRGLVSDDPTENALVDDLDEEGEAQLLDEQFNVGGVKRGVQWDGRS